MKFLPSLLIAFAAIAPLHLTAAPVPADSRITAVTVYLDRAVVTRTATVDLTAAGALEAAFERLPATLLDASLQVSGRGNAPVTILDVTARETYVDFTPNERVKSLEDQLRALRREDRTLGDRQSVLHQQRDYVLKIQTATTTPAKDAPGAAAGADSWLQLLTFTEEQLGKIASELQTLDTQREDLQAKRTALEQQLNELRGEGGRSFKTAVVRLSATAAGKLELTLRYAVPGANWTPNYDARVSSSARTVQLGYFGEVRQNTGEDWKAVELTLSTAQPSLGGAAPELKPWVVQQQQFMPLAASAPMFRERAQKAEAAVALGSFNVAADSAGRTEDEARYVQAEVQAQATSASFRIAVPATLPSDNSPQKIPVTTVDLAMTPEYQATPKLVPGAFLTAKVSNTSEFPLLAGAMNVFLDETFVAASHLRTVMPGEKFDLALGADEGLAIKRKLNNRFTEDTGVVTKSRRITYDITLSVQNNKRTAETLILRDQLPVSRHEKIVVKQIAPDERQVRPDAEGILKWTLTLNPGEKREIPLKFSVEHPNDLAVAGLE